MSARVIALAQQKGGVGKTTTTINLGAALAKLGRQVLLIDLDPQGALSAGLGVEPLELEKTIYDVLRSTVKAETILLETEIGCHLLPSNIDLAASELELVSEPGRERVLKEKITPLLAQYDYALIDCPPSLSLLTLNALSASVGVIIPVQTQYFALRGMDLLFNTIEKVRTRLNPQLSVTGILPTLHQSQTLHAKEVLEDLNKSYGDLMFSTPIPMTVKLADSVMAGQSIFDFMAKSPAAIAYKKLAKEVEQRA